MSLQGCVSSLSASCNILDSSLATLDTGISDFPRLIHVLQNTRHFELLPESDVVAAQNDLRGEIGPQREELLARVEKALHVLERKEYNLKSKKELQEVRLQQKPNRAHLAQSTSSSRPSGSIDASNQGASDAGNAERAEKLRMLKSKKERLAYSLKRLQMEEQGRKTRMSLAPGAFQS